MGLLGTFKSSLVHLAGGCGAFVRRSGAQATAAGLPLAEKNQALEAQAQELRVSQQRLEAKYVILAYKIEHLARASRLIIVLMSSMWL